MNNDEITSTEIIVCSAAATLNTGTTTTIRSANKANSSTIITANPITTATAASAVVTFAETIVRKATTSLVSTVSTANPANLRTTKLLKGTNNNNKFSQTRAAYARAVIVNNNNNNNNNNSNWKNPAKHAPANISTPTNNDLTGSFSATVTATSITTTTTTAAIATANPTIRTNVCAGASAHSNTELSNCTNLKTPNNLINRNIKLKLAATNSLGTNNSIANPAITAAPTATANKMSKSSATKNVNSSNTTAASSGGTATVATSATTSTDNVSAGSLSEMFAATLARAAANMDPLPTIPMDKLRLPTKAQVAAAEAAAVATAATVAKKPPSNCIQRQLNATPASTSQLQTSAVIAASGSSVSRAGVSGNGNAHVAVSATSNGGTNNPTTSKGATVAAAAAAALKSKDAQLKLAATTLSLLGLPTAETQAAVASAAASLKQRLNRSTSSSTSSNSSLSPSAGFVNDLSNVLNNIMSDNSDTDPEFPAHATTDLSESDEDSVSEDDIQESDPDSCAHEADGQDDDDETDEESEESDESVGDEEEEEDEDGDILQDNDADEEDIDDEDDDEEVQEVGGNFLLDANNDRSRNLTALFEAATNDKAPVLRHATHAIDEAKQALTKMRCANSPRDKTLVAACSENDVNTVRRLLVKGNVNVSEATDDGESLLSMACSAGYYELAQVLLAMSAAQVEDKGQKDSTPLMEASSAGHIDIVQLLLNHNADVNAHCANGNTPLMFACAGGHAVVVKELLKHGANVEDQNENGHTPLMEAASAGHVEVAKLLLEHGAGINTHSNEFKESALTLACYKGHLDMVRFLLEAGADQEHKTDEMHTALMEASMDGHVEVARLLLDSGAQVNMPTDSFESPLTLAACGGHVELATLLIERGANIEEVNDEGYTPLMEAAREGHEEMVGLLLSKGANINATTDETQETALTLACCGGFSEVAEFLIKEGANLELGASTPLMEAAQEGHTDLVRFLLQNKANVHAETQTHDTALTHACENGHTDAAEVLLSYGAVLEHQSEGGRTPLMKACRAGHLCTVKFLIQKGANVNKQTTSNDHTPLSLACAGGHHAVVELLLKSGADPYHKLKDNSTMLIEAAKGGHTRVVEILFNFPVLLQNEVPTVGMPPVEVNAMGNQVRVLSTQQKKLLQQQMQQQQVQQLSAPPGLHEVSEAVRASNQQLFHQQQFNGNSIASNPGEYLDTADVQLNVSTSATSTRGSDTCTEEYAAIDINSLSAQQQEALIAKSRLFHLQSGYEHGLAIAFQHTLQQQQQQQQQQQPPQQQSTALLPPPIPQMLVQNPLVPCKHVGGSSTTALDMGHIKSLTPPQKVPPAPPAAQNGEQASSSLTMQQQQLLIKAKSAGRKNRQAPIPFDLYLQAADTISQQQHVEEVRSQPVGDDGSGNMKLKNADDETRFVRRQGTSSQNAKKSVENTIAQETAIGPLNFVDSAPIENPEIKNLTKGASYVDGNENITENMAQTKKSVGAIVTPHASDILPNLPISERPKMKATTKNNRKQISQTAGLQQNQMVSIYNNLATLAANQPLDQMRNLVLEAVQHRQMQQPQKLDITTNAGVTISNSPASPLPSPSAIGNMTYNADQQMVDAECQPKLMQHGLNQCTTSTLLHAHKINSVMDSHELHQALEAACCRAATSILQEARGSTDSVNSLGVNTTGCTTPVSSTAVAIANALSEKTDLSSQMKILQEGLQLFGLSPFFSEQPKSPIETPPEMEEVSMVSPDSVGVDDVEETRTEMKKLATLCSALCEGENTLLPEPIEISEVTDDEDVASNSDADNVDDEADADDDLDDNDNDGGNIELDNNEGMDDNGKNNTEENNKLGGVKFTEKFKNTVTPKGRKLSTRLENLILSNVTLKPEMLTQALGDYRQDISHSDLVHVIPQITSLKTTLKSNSALQQQFAMAQAAVAAAAVQSKANKLDAEQQDEAVNAASTIGNTAEMYPVLENYPNEDDATRDQSYDISVDMDDIFHVIHNANDPSLQEFANYTELADFGMNSMCKTRWNGNWSQAASKWASQESFINATHQQLLINAQNRANDPQRQPNLLLLDYQLQQQEMHRFAEAEFEACEELQRQHQQATLSLIPFSTEETAAAVAAAHHQQHLQQTLPNVPEFHLQQHQQHQQFQQMALEPDQELKQQLQQLQNLQQQQQSNARLIKAVAAAAGHQQQQQQQQTATNFMFNMDGNDKPAQSLQLLFQLPTTVQQQQQQEQETAQQLQQQLQMHHQDLQDHQKQQQQPFKLLQPKHQTLQDLQADAFLNQQQEQVELDQATQNNLLLQRQAALAQQVINHQAIKQKHIQLQEQLILQQQQQQQQQACVQHTQQVQVATQTQPSVVVPHPNAVNATPAGGTQRASGHYYGPHFGNEHGQMPLWPMNSNNMNVKTPGGISKKAIDKQSRKDRRFSLIRQTPTGSQANTTVQQQPQQPQLQQQQQQPQQQPQQQQQLQQQPVSESTDATAAPQDKTIEVDSETDSNHDTALTLACAGGHEELVEFLISRNANIEHRDKKGFTPLILAATAGHEKVVEILLKNHAELEAQSERTKDTPLSLACSGGRYEVVELLLGVGANKEHRNVSDYTPLCLAASGGYVNIIKLLLTNGAEINSRTGSKLGISPLMLAAMNGHTAAVKLLLDQGSDINAQIETNRNTALTLACFQGRHEVVSLLLDRKANVEHRAKTGLTPLMEAASGGYIEVGRVLLDKGADVNAAPVPTSRDTALTIAADKGHQKFVELLLSRGASVEVKNKKGNSPLWLAAHGGHLSVVELLFDHNADIDSQDNRRVSCLMAAFRKGHTKIVKWMVQYVTQFPSDQEMNRFLSTISDKELCEKCYDCMKIIRSAKEAQAMKADKNACILLEELDMERTREESRKAAAARKRERKKKKKMEKKQEKMRQMEGSAGEHQHQQQQDDVDDRDSDKDDDSEKDDDDEDNQNPREEGDSGIDQGSCSSGDTKGGNVVQQQTEKINNNNNKSKSKKQQKKGQQQQQQTVALVEESSKKLTTVVNKKEDIKNTQKKQLTNNAEPVKSANTVTKRTEHKKEEPVASKPKKDINNKKEKENMAPKEAPSIPVKQSVHQSQHNQSNNASHSTKEKLINTECASNISTRKALNNNTTRNDDKKSEDSNIKNTTNVLKRSEIDGWKEVVRKSSTQQVTTTNPLQTAATATSVTAVSTNTTTLATTSTVCVLPPNNSLPVISNASNVTSNSSSPSTNNASVPEMICKKVQVPVNAISRVIGRAGSNINAIRATTGAHIEVEKQGKNQSERSITIKGLSDATKQAHMLILALIKDPDVDILQMLPRINSSIKATSTSTPSSSALSPMSVGTWDNKTAAAALQTPHPSSTPGHFSSAASTTSTSSASSASSTPAGTNKTGANNKTSVNKGQQQSNVTAHGNKQNSNNARTQPTKPYYSQQQTTRGSNSNSSLPGQKIKGQDSGNGSRIMANSVSQKSATQMKSNSNYTASNNAGGQTFAAKLTGTQQTASAASPKKNDLRSGIVAPYGRGKPVTSSSNTPLPQLGHNHNHTTKNNNNSNNNNTLAGPIGTFNVAEVAAVNAAAAAAAAAAEANKTRAVTPIAPPSKSSLNKSSLPPAAGPSSQMSNTSQQQQQVQKTQHQAGNTTPVNMLLQTPLRSTNQNLFVDLTDVMPANGAAPVTNNSNNFSTTLAAKLANEYSLFNDYQPQWGKATAVGDNIQYQNPVNVSAIVSDMLPQADASKAPGYNRNILNSPVGSSKASSNHSSSPPATTNVLTNQVQQALNIITSGSNAAASGGGSGSGSATRSPLAEANTQVNGTQNTNDGATVSTTTLSSGIIKPPTAPIQRPLNNQLHAQNTSEAVQQSALHFCALSNTSVSSVPDSTAEQQQQQQQGLQRFYEQLNAAQQLNYPMEQTYSSAAANMSRLNPRATTFSQVAGNPANKSQATPPQQQQQQQAPQQPAQMSQTVQQQTAGVFPTNPQNYSASKPLIPNPTGMRPQNAASQRWYGGTLEYPTYGGRDVLQLENGGSIAGVNSPASMSPNQTNNTTAGMHDDTRAIRPPRPIGTERANWKYNNYTNVAAAALNMDESLSSMPPWILDPKSTNPQHQQTPNWLKQQQQQQQQQYRYYNNAVPSAAYARQHEPLNIPMDYHNMQPPNLSQNQHINLMPPYAFPHYVGHTATDMTAAHMPEKIELWEQHDKHPWATNWSN